jgi:hypothetical protein
LTNEAESSFLRSMPRVTPPCYRVGSSSKSSL